MSPARTVTFGAACAGCPLRERCTTARDGRSMTIHPHEGLLRAARAQSRTAEFRQAYPTRSMIERVIAWTATQNGRRVKLRYIGTAKNDAWLHNRCAALNLRTLLRHGLTRSGGAWVSGLTSQHTPARPGGSPCGPLRGFCCRAAAARPAARRASGRSAGTGARPAGHVGRPPDPGCSVAS